MSDAVPHKNSRITLWLIVAVCVAPMLASYIAFYVWQPVDHVNHGTLLPPRPLPDAQLKRADGTDFRFPDLRGQWIIVVTGGGACGDICERNLTYARQVRLAQGKESGRIERLWLVTDEVRPSAALMERYAGTLVVHAAGSPALHALPAAGTAGSDVYVIDPLGNLMMRYPPDLDPRRMLKDIARLLRHSKWK
jgi:hypothetical protein